MKWLVATRLPTAAAGAAAIWSTRAHLPSLGTPVIDAAGITTSRVPSLFGGFLTETAAVFGLNDPQILGALIAAGGVWAAYKAVAWLWSRWEYHDIRRLLRRRHTAATSEPTTWDKATRGLVFFVTGLAVMVAAERATGESVLFWIAAVAAGVVMSALYARVSDRLGWWLSDRTVARRETVRYDGQLGEGKLALAATSSLGALVGCVFALLTVREIVEMLGGGAVSRVLPLTFLMIGGGGSYMAHRELSKGNPMVRRIAVSGLALTAVGIVAGWVWPLLNWAYPQIASWLTQ